MAGRFTAVGIELVIRGMTQWNQGNKTLRRQMGLTGAQVKRMSKQFSGASSAILNFGNNIRNVGNQVLILGFQLTFLASGAMLGVISQSVKFEESMVKIITLVGVAEKQVAEWADQLLELAPALGRSPNELAEALFVITSAGIRGATEAIDTLIITAKAASIGLGETEAVARVVTGVMQAYGDSNITAAKATDILVATVREGNLEVETLAPTLGRVIATAANMGVSFAEVGAFIATFTRTAVPAEVSVTSLRAALNAILKPTAAAEAKLNEYGISMQDIRDAIDDPERGLHDTLLALMAVFGDSNEQMAKVIGSARGLAGIFTVTGGLSEEYVEIFNNVNESMGITNEGFERFAETTTFLASSAKASLEVLAITLGVVLLPGINAVLAALIPLFNKLAELAELHPKIVILAGALGAFVTVIGPLLIISGLLVSSLGTLIIAIGAFATFITSLVSGWMLIPAAIFAVFSGMAIAVGVSLGDARKKLDEKGMNLTTAAFEWGSNIVLALARGMGAAVAAVTKVLIIIGNHIRTLLEAFSPPRLLPDIDVWGKNTMEAWIEGWLDADFSKFNDIASLVESTIRSLTFDKDLGGMFTDKEGLTAVISSRTGIAGAIEQIRETGVVTKKALDELFDPAIVGKSSDALKEYVLELISLDSATKELATAQQELNNAEERFTSILDPLNSQLDKTQKRFREVLRGLNDELERTTKSFASALKPIDDEIKGLTDARQAIIDQREREALLELIANAAAPEQAKEVARMRLRHMELVKQKVAIEDERDTATTAAREKIGAAEELRDKELESLRSRIEAEEELRDIALETAQLRVDSAQEAVDAAQGILDATEEQIRLQIENNDLLKEYARLLESSSKKTGKLADAVGDLADVIGGGLPPYGGKKDDDGDDDGDDDSGGIFENLQKKMEALVLSVEELAKQARQEFLDAFGDTSIVDELSDIWSDILVDAATKLDTEGFAAAIAKILLAAFGGAIVGIGAIIIEELKKPETTEDIKEVGKRLGIAFINGIREAPTATTGAVASIMDTVMGMDDTPSPLQKVADAVAAFTGISLVIAPFLVPLGLLTEELLRATDAGGWLFNVIFNLSEGVAGDKGRRGGRSLGGSMSDAAEDVSTLDKMLKALGLKVDEDLTPSIDKLAGGTIEKKMIPATKDLTDKFGQQKIAVDRDLTPVMVFLNDFLVDSLGPTIGTTLVGVVVDVKKKFLDWRDVVKNKAQKALEALEAFLGVDFSETMTTISDYLDETFTPAVTLLQETWVLLKDAFAGPITTAFNAFRTAVLDPLTVAIGNIKQAISDLLVKAQELIDKLPDIEVPWPFGEKSPSPFEQGIRHVMAAMEEMTNEAAPALAASMRGELGSYVATQGQRSQRMSVMPMRQPGMVSHREVNMNMGGQTINNGMDAAGFQALVERAMRNAV